MEKIKFLNTSVNNISLSKAVAEIISMVKNDIHGYVVPINVDVVLKSENDPLLKRAIDESDICLLDGMPLVWISKIHGTPVKEKVSGSDLVPALLRQAAKSGMSVFILGGKEGIPEMAMKNIMLANPGIVNAGCYSPPFGFENYEEELDKINKMISDAHPDILLACFGCPKQELWVYGNRNKCRAKVIVCAGATVDFLAGNVKRCPRWMSEHGLEWFYRFTKEPKRLFRRYFIEGPKIIKIALKYRNHY